MGILISQTNLANTAGYTGYTQPIINTAQPVAPSWTSDMGDLGSMLFGHGPEHAVLTNLPDAPVVFGEDGGFVAARAADLQKDQQKMAATAIAMASPSIGAAPTPPLVDFANTVQRDLNRLGTFVTGKRLAVMYRSGVTDSIPDSATDSQIGST